MLIQDMQLFPSFSDYETEIAIGDQTYILRFTYQTRRRGWYMSMRTLDDEYLLSNKRVEPDAPVMITPLCVFYFAGDRCVEQEDLGTRCFVTIWEGEDIFYG